MAELPAADDGAEPRPGSAGNDPSPDEAAPPAESAEPKGEAPGGAEEPDQDSAEAEAPPEEANQPPARKGLSLAGLGGAFMAIIGRAPAAPATPPVEPPASDSTPQPAEGAAGSATPLLLAEEEGAKEPMAPPGDGPGEDTPEVAPEEEDAEAAEEAEGPAAGRRLVSGKGLMQAFGSLLGGGAKAPAGPAPADTPKRSMFSWLGGGAAKPGLAVRTPAAFGPPRTGTPQEVAAIPSLVAALDAGGAPLETARAEAAGLLLRAPAAFAAVEVSTGWPPAGKRPSFGPFWARSPAWLAATADTSATLCWPQAGLDTASGEVKLGEPAWSGARRGPVCVYAMGPAGVQEGLRREWHREAYLAAGQSLDAALEGVYDRYGVPDPERWEAALGLLASGNGEVRLAGRAGLFGLGKRQAVAPLAFDAAGAKALLTHLTVPAAIHLVLRHVRRTRAAVLAALVPGDATLRLGWADSGDTEFPEADGALAAPRAHLGSPEAALHPQKDMVSARGGASWSRRHDEGDAGWMLRLAVERVVYREGWLDTLERAAADSWNALARLGGGPRLEFGGERRWPWTEALIAEVAGSEPAAAPALAAQVLSRIDLFAHAAPGNPRPFSAHVRRVIERTLLLS